MPIRVRCGGESTKARVRRRGCRSHPASGIEEGAQMSEATGSTSPTIRLELDPELKGQWETQRKKIAEAQKEGATSFIALWKSVAEVVDHSPPLFLAAGFSN